MITQELLKKVFHYDGKNLIWVNPTSRGIVCGAIAGTICHGYIQIQVDKKLYRAHRLIWQFVYGHPPVGVIDHINGIRDDNRIENLRDTTYKENNRNASLSKANVTGAIGVTWYKAGKKWAAQITVNSNRIHLGYFDILSEAIKVRAKASKKYNFHENHGKPQISLLR